MNFEPIAIVGRGALFPSALSPAALWKLAAGNCDAVSRVPRGRWRIADDSHCPEGISTDRGGYVDGFDRIFDPSGFAISAADLASHDPTVHWLLHTAREALREAGINASRGAPRRTGAVVGLLGLPSESMAQFAEQVWVDGHPSVAPANRFASGLPAHLLARALQLDLGAFSLDAACASSLYAIKLACDELQDGRADLMLAGAANRADNLFLHIGFSTLKALSPTGRSRPFHRAADGLLPSEGAGFVALKRLEDAEASGNRILGVIRGIGTSNDGRTAGLLTPSEVGQEQAMRDAYAMAGLAPSTISLIECHATGTSVGDACEIRSMSSVFEGCRDIPLGSIKANFGHALTAAGIAGLLKLLGALEHSVRSPLLHIAGPSDAIGGIAGSPFRVPCAAEPWETPELRRAALNAFGFGGNNAHLIVEEYRGKVARPAAPSPLPASRIAIVSMGVCAGEVEGVEAFTRAVFQTEPHLRRTETASFDPEHLGFPPADLAAALPQQVLALQAASEALDRLDDRLGDMPKKTGVYVGMGCDTEAARIGLRWRSLAFAGATAESADSICPPVIAAAVVGRLANIVANRISSKFDFRGPSFAVMAEELSGLIALRLAVRALSCGEVDRAVVGAVDLSCDPVHEAAVRSMLPPDRQVSGDAAVFHVLTRLEDAPGEVLAILDANDAANDAQAWSVPAATVEQLFGHAHAASGLMQASLGVLACAHGALPPASPWLTAAPRRACVEVQALGGAAGAATFAAAPGSRPKPLLLGPAPQITVYSGADRLEVLEALRLGRVSVEGPARLALVATSEAELRDRRESARQALEAGGSPWLDGVYFQPASIGGELALVFPGAAAAYRGMGRSLLLAFPELLDPLAQASPRLLAESQWIFDPDDSGEPGPSAKLWGSSLLSQAHARFTRTVLGISPQAAIGVSSGETNSLAAFGVWRDLDRFQEEFTAAGVLDRALGGSFDITGGAQWEAWHITLPEADLPRLLQEHPGVRLTGIFAPGDYTIAGDPDQCAQAAHGIGRGRRLHYDLAIHCPEFAPYAETWRALHDRESFHVPAVRFYTHATGTHYRPDRSAIADALTQQAMKPLDFRALIERAWEDGVRIFLEQGPQGGCALRIRRILGNREHLAIAMDLAGVDSLRQAANALAQLIVSGVEVPNANIFERFRTSDHTSSHKTLTIPMHAPPVAIPPAHRQAFPPATAFERHARALVDAHTRFQEASAAAHRNFLEISERAYLQAVSRSPAPRHQFTREDLERLSSGPISEVLGAEFRPLDHFRRVVRLPKPPLLLADRVTSLEGHALRMGTGSISTETDVRPDSWYLYRGRMPAGLLIEAGQADLLLISWLGIDLHTRGERVYRLLGCDVVFHGGLPRPADALHFDIHIDRHARQGAVRLFFFHYDCRIGDRLLLSIRNAQAGFFSDEELARSAGVLWNPDASDAGPQPEARFTLDRLRAAAAGDIYACFGAGFETAAAHQRSPGFAAPDLLLLHTVTHLRFHHGAESNGYLRVEFPIDQDAWFFDGHFQDDPCMPGNLMLEGCLQAMSFYMMASGMTIARDGWRFEPVPGVTYSVQCRGQVTPSSRVLIYEVFVRERADHPEPVLFADVLCTVDGLKAFVCRRLGLRLTPGYPLDEQNELAPVPEKKQVASVNGVALDRNAMLASAWGSPTDAFGAPYARFANGERFPRLPGPPYLLMHRITKLEGEFGVERAGCKITAECDLDPSDWFFAANQPSGMPLAALLEAGLQPCGWLGNFIGVPLRATGDLSFRNLDGNAKLLGSVPAGHGSIRTEATLVRIARSAGITLATFDVRCDYNETPVLSMQTSFGFFPPDDLARPAGLPGPPATEPRSAVNIDLSSNPPRYCAGPLRLPSGKLSMLSRVTGFEPPGEGPAGERTGWMRAEIDLSPSAWFFKAHFYQDPVQPGSLGLEALMQALRFYVIEAGLAEGIANGAFLPDGGVSWKYRGQVTPANRLVTVEVFVKRALRSPDALMVRAEGWLSVGGLPIYHCADFGLKVVSP
jgi:acyl transferase domain-containing protein/3-hydroxymyristoyl/3-hydroxydecanoyl-(acyl carrier protein) dehydratase